MSLKGIVTVIRIPFLILALILVLLLILSSSDAPLWIYQGF